jgi:hypothetical protein
MLALFRRRVITTGQLDEKANEEDKEQQQGRSRRHQFVSKDSI